MLVLLVLSSELKEYCRSHLHAAHVVRKLVIGGHVQDLLARIHRVHYHFIAYHHVVSCNQTIAYIDFVFILELLLISILCSDGKIRFETFLNKLKAYVIIWCLCLIICFIDGHRLPLYTGIRAHSATIWCTLLYRSLVPKILTFLKYASFHTLFSLAVAYVVNLPLKLLITN